MITANVSGQRQRRTRLLIGCGPTTQATCTWTRGRSGRGSVPSDGFSSQQTPVVLRQSPPGTADRAKLTQRCLSAGHGDSHASAPRLHVCQTLARCHDTKHGGLQAASFRTAEQHREQRYRRHSQAHQYGQDGYDCVSHAATSFAFFAARDRFSDARARQRLHVGSLGAWQGAGPRLPPPLRARDALRAISERRSGGKWRVLIAGTHSSVNHTPNRRI